MGTAPPEVSVAPPSLPSGPATRGESIRLARLWTAAAVRDAAQDHEDLPLLLEESESSGADSRVYLDEASEEEEDGSTQGRRSRHHGRRTARAWGDWMAYGVHGTNARGHAALPWAGTGGALAFGGDARGWFRTGPGAGARRRGPEAGDDDDDWVFGRTGEGREEGQSDPGVRLHSPFSAPERLWHGEEGSRGRGGGGRDASGREGGEAVGADEVADSYRRGRSRRNSKAHAEGDSDASGPTRRVSGRDTRSTTGGADGAGVAAGETAARDAAPPSNGRRAGGWHARPEGAGGAPPASVFPSAAPRMGAAGDGGDLFKDPAPTHARGKSPDARVVLDVPPLVRPKPRVDVEWGGLEPGACWSLRCGFGGQPLLPFLTSIVRVVLVRRDPRRPPGRGRAGGGVAVGGVCRSLRTRGGARVGLCEHHGQHPHRRPLPALPHAHAPGHVARSVSRGPRRPHPAVPPDEGWVRASRPVHGPRHHGCMRHLQPNRTPALHHPLHLR